MSQGKAISSDDAVHRSTDFAIICNNNDKPNALEN